MRLQTNTLMLMKINFTRLVNLEAFVHFKMKTNITRIILRHMLFNYGVRSSQLMLNPVDYPSSFGITVLADSTIDLLAPVISRGKGSIIKDPRGNKKMFSASVASLRTNSHGDVLEYGSHEMSISSRTLKNHNAISGLSQKGSVNIPGALKSFSSEVFHGHLFNVKRSNAIVLDQTKPMIQDDEIAYLAGVTDALFCQVGYRAGNHALKVAIKHFTGTKLVIFGGRVESKVANDLIFFLSYDSGECRNSDRDLKVHLSAAPIRFSAVERLARSIAGATCKLTELSVDVTSVGVLGLLTILSSLRVRGWHVDAMSCFDSSFFPRSIRLSKS